MYSYIKAISVRKGVNQRWTLEDISAMTVAQIYSTFRKCYLHLKSSAPEVEVFCDMESLKPQYNTFTGTLLAMLADIGVQNIATIPTPKLVTKIAKYRDAIASGYKATLVHPLYGTNTDIDNKPDMLLTRSKPAIDYFDFYNHCLVSVNGLYHLIDTDKKSGILVKEAGRSLRISNMNQIGIYSFKDLTPIKYIPIKESMIYKGNTSGMPLANSLYIDLGMDTTNKVVIFVITGYLHEPFNNHVSEVGIGKYKFDIANYDLLGRYFEAKQYIDLSSMGIDITTNNPTQVQINDLYSDEKIIKFFTLSQSFAIVLDCPEVYVQKHFIMRSDLFGMYTSFVLPNVPIVTPTGRHPEYLFISENKQYSIKINDNTISNRFYDTNHISRLTSASDSMQPMIPHSSSVSYLLEIGRDI